jgi:hypothetical protein
MSRLPQTNDLFLDLDELRIVEEGDELDHSTATETAVGVMQIDSFARHVTANNVHSADDINSITAANHSTNRDTYTSSLDSVVENPCVRGPF